MGQTSRSAKKIPGREAWHHDLELPLDRFFQFRDHLRIKQGHFSISPMTFLNWLEFSAFVVDWEGKEPLVRPGCGGQGLRLDLPGCKEYT